MFMAITTTIRPSHALVSMLMPNTRASIVKLSVSMKRNSHHLHGTPRKIVASPVLMAVLRRLEAKNRLSSNPEKEEGLTKGVDSIPLLDELSHKGG